MTYATLSDLVTRYGTDELAQRTDRLAGQNIDQTVVDRALADADAEIDSNISRRYALPLASVPALLVRLACVLARYYIHDEAATEAIVRDYDDAIRTLAEIRDGKRQLTIDAATQGGSTTPEASPTGGGNGVRVRSPSRIFTDDLMARFGRF